MIRRVCLGCGEGYDPAGHACPACGSHAGNVVDVGDVQGATREPQAKPARTKRPGPPKR